MSRGLVLAACVLGLSARLEAAQPQFWKIEGARDFLDGDTEGLSVDSEGRLRIAPASRPLHDPEAPYVWSLVRDEKGILSAGTGNDGKVFRVQDGKGALFFDAAELEVHALAAGPDGRLYVGTSPEGKVYAVDAKGKAETFYDPADKYIWGLAFDRSGNLFVATGSEARLHKVNRKGEAQVVLTSPETHVTALAIDASGTVYAGSAPSGIIYRVDTALKVFVLHDAAYREVKAIDVGEDGSVYAALVDGKEKDESRPAPGAIPGFLPATASAEVTVTESFTVAPMAAAPSPTPTPRPSDSRAGGSKGAVLRILPSGEVDTLWTSSDEIPQSLVSVADGALLGTGNKGKLYQIRNDRTWTMLASFPAEQVTGLFRGAGGSAFVGTSNPGKLHALEAQPGVRGTFTSKVRDTDTVSSWGRIRWEAQIPSGTSVQLQTRSGNTASPDTTWSDWSTPYTRSEGDGVKSERARFLQVKAVLASKDGASPVLDSVSTAYLQRNLRPQVQSVTVHPPGEVFQKPLSLTGEVEVLGLEPGASPGSESRPGAAPRAPSTPATTYARKLYQRGLQTFSWRADDPNGDSLAYEVYYRSADDQRFRLLRKGLADAVVAWDTSTVPNGRYVIRVRAADSPANPEALALWGEKESAPFYVDNTPPVVTATLAKGPPARVQVAVRDDSSLVRKAEYSIDGSRWQEVHPTDGISDSLEESYDIALGDLTPPRPHVLVVRATDLLGNVATARVEIP